jgi:hypothetical protein
MKKKNRKVKRFLGGRFYERTITKHSLLTSMETAQMLGNTQRHIYDLSKAGILRTVRKGKGKLKRLFFVFGDVQKYLKERG